MIYAVIGANFGDEGKGLAVDFLASRSDKALVVRHNGGAQAGHTVELPGRRFVFHELSSGSFRGADTYWAQTFLPDLYHLGPEAEAFRREAGFTPRIFASAQTCVTTVDDVLLNMLQEDLRGENRHGSCGMGINEADLRGKAGAGLPLEKLRGCTARGLYGELRRLRESYTRRRLEALGLGRGCDSEYREMLEDDNVLRNYAARAADGLRYVTVAEASALTPAYADVIFENGQGLRLDAESAANYPHVTASRTGLTNVRALTGQWGVAPDEAVYVTRAYLTRHGAGPLKNEIPAAALPRPEREETNVGNRWQGDFRYALHESAEDLLAEIRADLEAGDPPLRASLFVTHLNETDGRMTFRDAATPVGDFLALPAVRGLFRAAYLSASRYAADVQTVRL